MGGKRAGSSSLSLRIHTDTRTYTSNTKGVYSFSLSERNPKCETKRLRILDLTGEFLFPLWFQGKEKAILLYCLLSGMQTSNILIPRAILSYPFGSRQGFSLAFNLLSIKATWTSKVVSLLESSRIVYCLLLSFPFLQALPRKLRRHFFFSLLTLLPGVRNHGLSTPSRRGWTRWPPMGFATPSLFVGSLWCRLKWLGPEACFWLKVELSDSCFIYLYNVDKYPTRLIDSTISRRIGLHLR